MTAVCTHVFSECAFALGGNTLVALPHVNKIMASPVELYSFILEGRQDDSYHQIHLESYRRIYLITKSNGIFCAISNLMYVCVII